MRFFKLYLAVSALSFVSFSVSSIAAPLSFLFFGINALIFPILLYLTALIPTFWLKYSGCKKIVYVPIGILSVIVLATLPPQLAQHKAKQLKQSIEAESLSAPIPEDWANLTFLEHVNRSSIKKEKEVHYAVCSALCQRLLVLKLVDKVTIKIANNNFGSEYEEEIIQYKLMPYDATCPSLYTPRRNRYFVELEMTKKEVAIGNCIVGQILKEVPDGIIIEHNKADYFYPKLKLTYIKKIKKYSVSYKSGEETKKLISKASYNLNKATLPFLIFGAEILSESEEINKYFLEKFIINDLGLDILPDKSIEEIAQKRWKTLNLLDNNSGYYQPNNHEIDGILSKPGDYDFSPITHSLISEWIRSLYEIDRDRYAIDKNRTITTSEINSLSKVIKDDRYTSLGVLSQLLHARPDLAEKLKHDFEERFARKLCQRMSGCKNLKRTLAKYAPDI